MRPPSTRRGSSRLSMDAITATFRSRVPDISLSQGGLSVPPSQPSQHAFTSQSPAPASSQVVPTRSNTLLDPRGLPYWTVSRKEWSTDGADGRPSSLDLLFEWLEIPNNWRYFHSGMDGHTATQMQGQCTEWLRAHFCPTVRAPGACGRKVCFEVRAEPLSLILSCTLLI